ncbi:MAG: carbohydrate ABC transporter permease [Bacillota bacterium]
MTRVGLITMYTVLILGAATMLLPFLYMLATAVNPETWIMPYPPTLWPANATMAHFVRAWTEAGFQRYALNSLIVSLVSVAITFVVSTLSAYGFARLEFPGKEWLYGLYLVTMMIPDLIALLPKFTVVNDLGLMDSWLGLWVIYVSSGVAGNTFLLRGFFEEIPRELSEATLIDGGSHWTIYTRVVMPLAAPALATLSIFSFLGAWDDFWWASLLLRNPDLRTLPIGIRLFFNAHGTQWSTVFAATSLAVVPELLMFIFLQRYFIQGLRAGGVKG